MTMEPCEFCGYEFDQELLGTFGCPNCYGEGLRRQPPPDDDEKESD